MRVGIATDHGGFSLKEELIARLRAAGHEIVDFGAHALNADDDYPDLFVPLAQGAADRPSTPSVTQRGKSKWPTHHTNTVQQRAPTPQVTLTMRTTLLEPTMA